TVKSSGDDLTECPRIPTTVDPGEIGVIWGKK
ncbi:unnamed protein product, partial [marine sediment metagenome]